MRPIPEGRDKCHGRFWKMLDKNMELVFLTVVISLGCVALLLFLQWKNLQGPPCIRGWIPWIGAGFEFGKAPLEFIEKARIKVCGVALAGGVSGEGSVSFIFFHWILSAVLETGNMLPSNDLVIFEFLN